MSWWDTDEGDDVIGDQPADLVRHSLQEIAAGQKPGLEDLLRAISTVTKSDSGRKLLENVPAKHADVVAKLKSGETVSASPADEPDKHLVASLQENLKEIKKVYQERWERNPRLTEWLSTFAFVLRYRPEDFLEDGATRPPADLRTS